MISDDRFLELVASLPAIARDLRVPENGAQKTAVLHAAPKILQIVAGPGSGKTTVLVLRALRAVFVEDVLPENILITTFTRKAARELRTRWLDWGIALTKALQDIHNLDRIDLNRCRIDTLDSIAEHALTDYRLPGTIAPMVAEESASNLILKYASFRELYNKHQATLDKYFSKQTFDGDPPPNQGTALKIAKRIIERLIQDRVSLDSFKTAGRAQAIMVKMLEEYRNQALENSVYDFTILEEQFLERLGNGSLKEWLGELKVILIDEYQDTNPLQEAIYTAIVKRANPSLTIVGDDDQSMYRFRGGSVELFTDFAKRWKKTTKKETQRVDMLRNFRSRPEIIAFYNRHITGDTGFKSARIRPSKPLVVESRKSENLPVLGMFRPSKEQLAADLAEMLHNLKKKRQARFVDKYEITLPDKGDLGDAVFLSHSVGESKYDGYKNVEKDKFPLLLRAALTQRGINVFNPRGQALRTIPDVATLLGLLLMAVDPDNTIFNGGGVMPTNEARFFLNQWREAAQAFVKSNPKPYGLNDFLKKWQEASRGKAVNKFPRDWPVLELIFKFLSWMPQFQSDAEHQVWLEAITRVVASAGSVSPYGMQLIQNYWRDGKIVTQTRKRTNGTVANDVQESRNSFVRDALLALAGDETDIDEDIMPSVPRDRLQFMTIHQAKGLEFPLVIVDVGSQFKIDSDKQRFLRFPDDISNVVVAEDDVEPHLSAPLRAGRPAMDRTFDDLARLYYVAYSRPQSVLLLVGCEKCLKYGKGKSLSDGVIRHIALGWNRDRTWPWRQAIPPGQRRPPVLVEPPIQLI